VHQGDDAHDADDAELLRELARLRAGGGDANGEREIMATLIGGWEPIFKGWLVSRIGPQGGEEVSARIVVRLVVLLVSGRNLSAAWGACVWRIVRDESFRYYRGREQSRERLVPEVYADLDAVPTDDPLEELPLDPEDDARRLTELVKELSDRDQRVIELTIIDERPRPEAAALLGLTVNALNQARHRAVQHLANLAVDKGVSGGGNSDEERA
jgi:DNA-directed RNA polymerase specialized sigma24 family protein